MSAALIKRHTHREAVRFTLEWTIDNFRSFRNETEAMYGAGITMTHLGMQDDYQGRWFISVVPCYKETFNGIEKKYVSVFLNVSDLDDESAMEKESDKEPSMDKESDKESDSESANDSVKGADNESVSESANESDKESESESITESDKEPDNDSVKESMLGVKKQKIPVEFSARVTTGKTRQEEIWTNTEPDVCMFTADDSPWGWDEAISHDDLFGSDEKAALLKDDCITVSLDVVVYKQHQSIQIPKAVVLTTAKDYQNFATRQLNWFNSQQQGQSHDLDFTLQSSDGQQFHSSRWILMAHSAVFAAMLKQNSNEAKITHYEMVDIDGETTEIMLNYLYGCCTQKINKVNAEKVLIMADKYQLMDLRHACERLLANNVMVDKAEHLLVLANQRGLQKLKTAALDFLPKNMAAIRKNGALKSAMETDPYLMQTIVEHCCKKARVIHES